MKQIFEFEEPAAGWRVRRPSATVTVRVNSSKLPTCPLVSVIITPSTSNVLV